MIARVVLANLPLKVGGYCVINDEGEKICVLNARHSFERNKKTLLHEQEHINNNDFDECLYVDKTEALRHE